MLGNWGLANFKSIKDRMDQLVLGDLTIFAGANSSGKSTVIQSILLMMQTLANRESAPLQLNGELVTLGTVEDLWHNGIVPDGSPENNLRIHMILRDPYNPDTAIDILLEFDAISTTQVILSQAYYGIGSYEQDEYPEWMTIAYRDGGYFVAEISDALRAAIESELAARGLSEIAPLDDAQVRIHNFYPRLLLVEARTMSREFNWATALADPTTFPVETEDDLKQPLPDEVWEVLFLSGSELGLPGLEVAPLRWLGPRQRAIKTFGDYRTWFVRLTDTQIRMLREQLERHLPGLVVNVQQWHSLPFIELIENTVSDIFTRRIRYLSANRLPPTMLFTPDIPASWSEVGITGANVAAALREHADKNVRFWDPVVHTVREATLTEALVLWLQFFQLVERIEAEDRGKLGTLLKVYATGVNKELDLTAVGFGTSQVLPIIVQGLLTPPKALFIVEQPEVHLHPHVQSQLAYFFFALTQVGVQCIIETHSEYIVNKLRLLIHEIPELRRQIKIYFAERSPEHGTGFQDVVLDKNGTITNWPKGFMDESASLAQEMLLAASKRV